MGLIIEGMGTAVPEHHVSQEEAAAMHADLAGLDDKRRRTLRAIYRRCGIERRHSVILEASGGEAERRQSFYRGAEVEGDAGPPTRARMALYEREAPGLAARAAGAALTDAGADPRSITHLVTVSCTGFFAPGLDAELVALLGLTPGTERTHVGFMGCHGALNGLRVARSFAEADPQARVLVCAVELCSLHFGYQWDGDALVSRALFADGAGAVVGRGGTGEPWTLASNGTSILPGSNDVMTWGIGDHGFEMTLSALVPELIGEAAPEWLEGWLGAQGMAVGDVASWAVHPGGPRVLEAFTGSMGLDGGVTDNSREVLRGYGNMSSATLLFILERMRRADAPRPCVALGFGPGLAIEAMLIR